MEPKTGSPPFELELGVVASSIQHATYRLRGNQAIPWRESETVNGFYKLIIYLTAVLSFCKKEGEMIKTDTGFIAVFTKYDNAFNTVIEPHLPLLSARSLDEDTDIGIEPIEMSESRYNAYYTEDGLEGVKFVHYI